MKKEKVLEIESQEVFGDIADGIPKKWRAEKYKEYCFLNSYGYIISCLDFYEESDNKNYELGNYFKTREEAQKVIDSKEWQEFWKKVRNGEIE